MPPLARTALRKRKGKAVPTTGDSDVSTLLISLPFEIIVEILAYASLLSTKTALSLCRVATWTKELGLEGLYGVASLSDESSLETFFEAIGYSVKEENLAIANAQEMQDRIALIRFTLEQMLPGHVPAINPQLEPPTPSQSDTNTVQPVHLRPKSELVRNLWLPTDSYRNMPMAEMLVAFKNLSNLSTPAAHLKHLVRTDAGFPGLHHLMLTTPTSQWDWMEPYLQRTHSLANLTHLFIATLEGNSCFVPMDSLPSLSHLAVPFDPTTSYEARNFGAFTIPARFLQYKQLQMVIVHYTEENVRGNLPPHIAERFIVYTNSFNSRLYAMPIDSLSKIKGFWKRDARGRTSVWRDAKVVLKRAQRALVKR